MRARCLSHPHTTGDAALAAVRSLASPPSASSPPDPALSALSWSALGLPPDTELLPPHQCKALWRQFQTDVEYAVLQARTAQEAAERAAQSSVPLWAIAAMVALGWNEVVWFLRHPVHTFILGVVVLFARAVSAQIDVAGAMRMGVIPGLMLVFSKVIPAALVVVQKLVRGVRGDCP